MHGLRRPPRCAHAASPRSSAFRRSLVRSGGRPLSSSTSAFCLMSQFLSCPEMLLLGDEFSAAPRSRRESSPSVREQRASYETGA